MQATQTKGSDMSSEAARNAVVQTAMEVDSAGVESLAVSSKTEGSGDRTLAAALYTLWVNGCHDDEGTDTNTQETLTRIDRYLFAEDSQGFISYREYADAKSAETFLESLTH